MKIYFAGSIRGGREDQEIYFRIIESLKRHGTVLTEHAFSAVGDDGQSNQYIYERDMGWLNEADVVVAEVTTPSLGVGYELGRAGEMKKPVLCLFRHPSGRRLSAMIAGNPSFRIERYASIEDADNYIASFFSRV